MDNIIKIVEGDYGVEYRLNIINGTPSPDDSFLFTIKDLKGKTLVSKGYTNVTTHIPLMLTKQESDLLDANTYLYSIDWYKNGVFQSSVINGDMFIVEKKV